MKARKFGSPANATTRPSAYGSSTTAAVPPSSSAPSSKPETNQRGELGSGNSTATLAASAVDITKSYS